MTDGAWDPDEPAPPPTDADAPEWLEEWELPPPTAYEHAPLPVREDDGEEHTSWWPVDLGPIFEGDADLFLPTMFTRTDGQPLLYPGKAHAFNGAPESGKSWAALVACVECINDGKNVLYLDFEDTAPTVVRRLLALGANADLVLRHLYYMSPSEALQWGGKFTKANEDFETFLETVELDLAILDGVTEAMGLHGWDINSNNDVAAFYIALPRRLQKMGVTTVNIDHIPKNREGGTRGGIGGQHKLAGIDVSFLFEVTAPFGIGQHGICRIVIEKDRPGQLRQHAEGAKHDRVAEFHLISDPETHALEARLEPYPAADGASGGFEPTYLMGKVSEFVAECNRNDQYPSQRTIEAGIHGKGEHIRSAIAMLVKHGHLQKGGNGRRITEHTLLTPYENDEEL